MKTNAQKLLPEHIPFYRKSIFWGMVFSVFFIFSTLLFINISGIGTNGYALTINQLFDFFSIAFSSTFLRFIFYDYFGELWQHIGSLIYFIFTLFLAYKTLQRPKVQLRYPIILSLLYITGMIASILLLGGLS